MFAFGTGLSYKLSKNDPHLTEFKDFIDSFQFEFYVVYFELGIIGQSGFSPYVSIQ